MIDVAAKRLYLHPWWKNICRGVTKWGDVAYIVCKLYRKLKIGKDTAMRIRPLFFITLSVVMALDANAMAGTSRQDVAPTTEKDTQSISENNDELPDSRYNESDADYDVENGAGYDVTTLDEFVIVQKKKLVDNDGAKLSYNVTEDPEAASSNLLDILRKVPRVTVDSEDNVKVNGQSGFKILMNGADNPMLKGDLKTILKSLPANSVKKIEVISEPGAKYDAEGVGGILNIVTDSKKSLEGYMAQASAWMNAFNIGGNLDGRMKFGNVMLSADVSYSTNKATPRSVESSSITEYLNGGPNIRQTSESTGKGGWDYTGANLNMSWDPDTLNLFTVALNYGYNSWGSDSPEKRIMWMKDVAADGSPMETPRWELNRMAREDGKYSGLGAQFSYQHNFGRDDNNLVASYMFNYGSQDGSSIYTIEDQTGQSGETPYSSTISDADIMLNIVQVDYNNRFSDRHLLESGGKMELSHTGMDSTPSYGESASTATADESRRVDVTQFKDIYALYASYSGTFGKFSVKAGLRYEHTRMGLRYKVGDMSDFTSRLNDVVPNAALSYNFTSSSNLRLAYQMRISRPSLSRLNPYVNTMTPGGVQYGNPDLVSEKNNNVSLGYSNYDNKFSGSIKATYSHTANWICDYIFMKDNLLNSTYANAGKRRMVTFDLSTNWDITDKLQWSAYFSATYQHIKADTELIKAGNHGWQYYINSNVNYTMPWKLKFSAYGGYYTGWLDLQSKGNDGYYYGLGFSRSFLKDDALNIRLSASNLFPISRSNIYTQTDSSVRLKHTSIYKQWNIGVSITFKIGGLTAGVKKTAADVNAETSLSSGGGNKGN